MNFLCNMNIAKKIEAKIKTIEKGETFTYNDLVKNSSRIFD